MTWIIRKSENSADSIRDRVLEVSLADLTKDEDQSFRKIKLRVEEVQGKNALTNFYGMDFTSDKLRSLVRKWQTLIEAHVDVKTTDGYLLRLFAIAFTRRRPNQVKKTAYAQTSQIRAIRSRMFEVMTRETVNEDLKGLVQKLMPEAIGREIEKACKGIFPLQNVFIRKVKVLKAPKLDVTKLLELHGETTDVRYHVNEVCEYIHANIFSYVVGDGHQGTEGGVQGARDPGLGVICFILAIYLVRIQNAPVSSFLYVLIIPCKRFSPTTAKRMPNDISAFHEANNDDDACELSKR